MCPDIWRVIITFKGFKLTFIKGLRGLLKCLTERLSLATPMQAMENNTPSQKGLTKFYYFG